MHTRLIIDDSEPPVFRRIYRPRARWQTVKDAAEALAIIAAGIVCILAVFLA